MSIITNYKLPETDEEIRANREKFVHALMTEPKSSQCRGQLYESPYEQGLQGEAAKAATHRRCAIGLAGVVFFNVKTEDELDKWTDRTDDGHPYGFDMGDEVAKMLGIGQYIDPAVSVSTIIDANDEDEQSFSQIGTMLREAWKVAA